MWGGKRQRGMGMEVGGRAREGDGRGGQGEAAGMIRRRKEEVERS